MHRVTATFRPSLITPYGTWHKVKGDWDGNTLWFTVPEGEHKGRPLGVHLASRAVMEPEPECTAQVSSIATRGHALTPAAREALAEISAIGQEADNAASLVKKVRYQGQKHTKLDAA